MSSIVEPTGQEDESDTRRGVATLATIVNNALLKNLSELLKKRGQRAAFAIGGKIPIATDIPHDGSTSIPVIVRWDGSKGGDSVPGRVAFPVSDRDQPYFDKLVADCTPATFGHGTKDVFDERVRKAGKLDEVEFSSNFSPYQYGIIDTISRTLLPDVADDELAREVVAELYKLNIYSEPSGRFRPHRDTPRQTSQFGSLVICLPYKHEGGQLVVRHGHEEVTFDWSTEAAAGCISWAAFFSDCEHEVLEVTEGHRVTLTYNLHFVPKNLERTSARIDPTTMSLYTHIREMLAEPGFMKEGGVLGLCCSHAYAHTVKGAIENVPQNLKGIDMVAYQLFRAAGLEVQLRPLIENKLDEGEWWPEYLDSWNERKWGPFDEWNVADRDPSSPVEGDNEGDAQKRELAYQDLKKLYGMDGRSILGKSFIPLVFTQMMDHEGENWPSIYNDWKIPVGSGSEELWPEPEQYEKEKVTWLNRPMHREPALVHLGWYGNERGVDTIYSAAALVIRIPPFMERELLAGQ